MMQPLQTYSGVVYPWHCDHVGHMNVMHYMGKFDDATWFFFDRIGLTRDYLAANRRGMAAVEQRIAYQRELRAGDVLIIHTSVLEARGKVLRFVHRMSVPDSDEFSALMMQTTVHLDMNLRKATALPDLALERAGALVTTMELPWDKRAAKGAP